MKQPPFAVPFIDPQMCPIDASGGRVSSWAMAPSLAAAAVKIPESAMWYYLSYITSPVRWAWGGATSTVGATVGAVLTTTDYLATYALPLFGLYMVFKQLQHNRPDATASELFTEAKSYMFRTFNWTYNHLSRQGLQELFSNMKQGGASYLYGWSTSASQLVGEGSRFRLGLIKFREAPLTKTAAMGTAAAEYIYNLMGRPKNRDDLLPFLALLGAIGMFSGLGPLGSASIMGGQVALQMYYANSSAKNLHSTYLTAGLLARIISSLPIIGNIPASAAFMLSLYANDKLSRQTKNYLSQLTQAASLVGREIPLSIILAILALTSTNLAQKLTGNEKHPIRDAVNEALDDLGDVVSMVSTPAGMLVKTKAQSRKEAATQDDATPKPTAYDADAIELKHYVSEGEAVKIEQWRKQNKALFKTLIDPHAAWDANAKFHACFQDGDTRTSQSIASFRMGDNHPMRQAKCMFTIGSDDVIVIGQTKTEPKAPGVAASAPPSKAFVYGEAYEQKHDTPLSEADATATRAHLLLQTITMVLMLKTSGPCVQTNFATLLADSSLQFNIYHEDPKMCRLLYTHFMHLFEETINDPSYTEAQKLQLRAQISTQIRICKQNGTGAPYEHDKADQALIVRVFKASNPLYKLHQRYLKHIHPQLLDHIETRCKPTQVTSMSRVRRLGKDIWHALDSDKSPTRPSFLNPVMHHASGPQGAG